MGWGGRGSSGFRLVPPLSLLVQVQCYSSVELWWLCAHAVSLLVLLYGFLFRAGSTPASTQNWLVALGAGVQTWPLRDHGGILTWEDRVLIPFKIICVVCHLELSSIRKRLCWERVWPNKDGLIWLILATSRMNVKAKLLRVNLLEGEGEDGGVGS